MSVAGESMPYRLRTLSLSRVDVERFRSFLLHAKGQLERSDAGIELAVDHTFALVEFVELSQSVELVALSLEVAGPGVQVGDRVLQVADERPLVGAGQETGGPELRPLEDLGGADHHEARQVLVLGAQAVDQPRTHAGPGERLLAGTHLQGSAGVVDVVGDHRADHTDVVDARRHVGKQFADLDARLARAS